MHNYNKKRNTKIFTEIQLW